MRLQTDQQFQQNYINNLNDRFSFNMFLTEICCRQAFAAEQNFANLKKEYQNLKE